MEIQTVSSQKTLLTIFPSKQIAPPTFFFVLLPEASFFWRLLSEMRLLYIAAYYGKL